MTITDTHTHLYAEQFDEDRDEVIKRALANGISRFFLPAIDSSYYGRMKDLQSAYPKHVFLMAGLHPTHVKEDSKTELSIVEKFLDEHTCYAVGEIGIDLYWDKTHVKEQQEAFRLQITLAKEKNYRLLFTAEMLSMRFLKSWMRFVMRVSMESFIVLQVMRNRQIKYWVMVLNLVLAES